jgi:hypothetical protein
MSFDWGNTEWKKVALLSLIPIALGVTAITFTLYQPTTQAKVTTDFQSRQVSEWPNTPDLKHFEEFVLSMEFVNEDSSHHNMLNATAADYMPGKLFSAVKVGPGLNELFISVNWALPFKMAANSRIPAAQQGYRRQIPLFLAKQYNLLLGTSVKRPFQVTFYFLETLPNYAYRYKNPGLLSVDRVWLLRFPTSYEDARNDNTVE